MSKVLIVGEFYTQEDEVNREPFSGASGGVLRSMLRQAGINPKDCNYATVFTFSPSRGSITSICGPKSSGIKHYPPVMAGKYVKAEYLLDLKAFHKTVFNYAPSMIIAFGAVASWALCQTTGMKNFRGTPLMTHSPFPDSLPLVKVIPTYGVSDVNKKWSQRPIVLADLSKAVANMEYPEIRRPERTIIIEPDLEVLASFRRNELSDSKVPVSVDIETARGQITCIGFAPSPSLALVVPIIDPTKPDGNYWATLKEELTAWKFITEICRGPWPKLFQNGLYDINYLWKVYGIPCFNATDDSMLLHHALQPEMPKALGFLGSVYTEEPSWKFMRTKHKAQKKED